MVLIAHPKHALVKSNAAVDVARLVTEPIVMNELTVGYGQVVLSLFTDLGTRPNILAIADNIETTKVIVQSGKAVAIVPRACAETEVALGALKAVSIIPQRRVALSLFRRRQPLSRRKQSYLSAIRDALRDA
jgi:DNA-binding transcriptional LysR family regulator